MRIQVATTTAKKPIGSPNWPPKLLAAAMGLLLACALAAQRAPDLVLEKMDLPDKILRSATQDSMGFLWFGSDNAIWKFNGQNFEKITHIAGDANALTYSPPVFVTSGCKNDLWIGTKRGGISRLQHRTGKYTTWRHNPDDDNTIGGNEIGSIAVEKNGTVWAGSNPFCLNRINPTTGAVQRYYANIPNLPPGQYASFLDGVALDPLDDNLLWIGTAFGILEFRKKEGAFTLHPFPEPVKPTYDADPVKVFLDQIGNVWTNAQNGAMKWLRQEQRWDDILLENWIEGKRLGKAHFVRYSKEEIAILSRFEGLFLHNVVTGTTQFVKNSDPAYNRTERGYHFLFKDRDGHLWSSTNTNFIRIAPREWSPSFFRYPNREPFNWNLRYLNVPGKNAVFVGTLIGDGLIYVDFDRDTAQAYRYSTSGIKGSDVRMNDLCFDAEQNVWIASELGLLKWNAISKKINRVDSWRQNIVKKTDQVSPEPTAFIKSVFYENGILWIGTKKYGLHALALAENQAGKWARTQAGLLGDVEINTIFGIGDGRLLIGTSQGLCLYNFEKNSFYKNTRFLIPGVDVTQIHRASDSTIWIGTYGHGLFQLDLSNATDLKQFTTTLVPNGNEIYDFTITKEHGIWMNTEGGTLSFDRQSKSFRHYPEFGVSIKWAITQIPNGNILTSRSFGIRYFQPKALMGIKNIQPVPYLSAINIGNRAENFSLSANYIDAVALQPSERELSIAFDALNFNRRPGSEFNIRPRTEFRYRILGLQDTWQSLKGQRNLAFNNLEAGDYLLEIQAINEYGKASRQPRRLRIHVLPPFYETLWFRVALLLFLVALAWVLYHFFRLRQMKKAHESAVQYFANSRYAENSVDEIIWDLARNVISRLNFEDCVVYLLDASDNMLIQKAAYGLKNPQGREITNLLSIPIGQGIVGHVAATGKPLLVPDTSQDNRYIADLGQVGSELAVPILYEGRVLGVLDSEHHRKGFFQETHLAVLVRIADQCARKIATAQVNEAVARQERELLNIQKEIAESKLTALQAQMNPHFIFNSLNSINWYILKNRSKEASQYLTKFSKLVRLILDHSKDLTIPLDKEVHALKLYLDLEAMRFEGKFEYAIQIDASIELEEVHIPPLILQPFVENAIWHGLLHKQGQGKLLLQVFPQNGHLKCIVEDNGIGRKAARELQSQNQHQHQSKGMQLTTDRLQLLHRDFLKADMIRVIDLEDETGAAVGTRVEVTLPYAGER
jgi:ligand-binding sensor domain-containing protein/putative methionine-R-sulfoxide reductase with GAF domain